MHVGSVIDERCKRSKRKGDNDGGKIVNEEDKHEREQTTSLVNHT